MWQTLWTFETAQFRIEWRVTPDHDVDLSFDETGETAANLESGLWVSFGSEVRVVHKATGIELGSDSLWGSIYERPSEFRDHIGMNARGHGSYFSDMVRQAVSEARANLSKLCRAAA